MTYPEWIEASEWVPDEGCLCLVCDAVNKIFSLGFHRGENSWELMAMADMTCDVCITHWMFLPEFPECEEE